MPLTKLLIANRGEIALRIARAAAALGLPCVAIFSEDDASALHRLRADTAVALRGEGPATYLDRAQVIAAAKAQGCDAIHPGYGFLSENAAFARACAGAGLTFVGPSHAVLDTLGDKARARALAKGAGVPVIPGSSGETTAEEAQAFLASLPQGAAMMIKAVAGGGGRGMRAVEQGQDVAAPFARCRSEAQAAFGSGALYVERLIRGARHIEVQVAGDASGGLIHLWERDCTLQRRNQKLVEIAPAPSLDPAVRARLLEAALSVARAAGVDSLTTVEFLVEPSGEVFFLEANPRLQVEHTVTEQVTGLDLVALQLRVAGGETLAGMGLAQDSVPTPRGVAVQLRLNLERMTAQGEALPTAGTLTAYEPASGAGVRVDGAGYGGLVTNPNFDSLLAKLIVHSTDFPSALKLALRALSETRIEGPSTNSAFLSGLLTRGEVTDWAVDTRLIERIAGEIVAALPAQARTAHAEAPEGLIAVRAPLAGKLIGWEVGPGDVVAQGIPVAVIEAMKMEHLVTAAASGRVIALSATPGSVVSDGAILATLEPLDTAGGAVSATSLAADPDHIRADLAEVLARQASLLDEARPDAVARRRKTGSRTARENLAHLFDDGDFLEFGGLALAAQRRRRTPEELRTMSPADGIITGVGQVNGHLFGEEAGRCVGLAYDYTVLAGTQGYYNHLKTDRMLELAEKWRAPVVMYTEGGGGRPGDTDTPGGSGLTVPTFATYARLSGLVPVVGVNSGFCFAGNAAFLGCSDVVIATKASFIGMGGPAMIEGGGLGTFKPTEIGPVADQSPNGVIDLVVEDEAAATNAARQYLSYFQGARTDWTCPDQRALRAAIPQNRLRVYDIRALIQTLCDEGSVLELRRDFGAGMITALVRIEGKPFGLYANNPHHLGGAIDGEAADKASRFMQLCDAFDLPLIALCDTPGFMVGPEVERTGQVRRVSRMFVTAASMTVPLFCVVLRKGYGLGAQAMAVGSLHEPVFTIAWPTGEFGPMGLEGAVRLGFKRELDAIVDEMARKAAFDERVARMYENGKALNVAALFDIDNVIDPATTRDWLVKGLRATPAPQRREGKKRPCIDTW